LDTCRPFPQNRFCSGVTHFKVYITNTTFKMISHHDIADIKQVTSYTWPTYDSFLFKFRQLLDICSNLKKNLVPFDLSHPRQEYTSLHIIRIMNNRIMSVLEVFVTSYLVLSHYPLMLKNGRLSRGTWYVSLLAKLLHIELTDTFQEGITVTHLYKKNIFIITIINRIPKTCHKYVTYKYVNILVWYSVVRCSFADAAW